MEEIGGGFMRIYEQQRRKFREVLIAEILLMFLQRREVVVVDSCKNLGDQKIGLFVIVSASIMVILTSVSLATVGLVLSLDIISYQL